MAAAERAEEPDPAAAALASTKSRAPSALKTNVHAGGGGDIGLVIARRSE
jgi:hypothetical protein